MKIVQSTVRRSGLLLCLLFLVGCATSQTDEANVKEDKLRAAESNTQLGLEYMNRGQHEVALGKLKKAVSDVPDYAPAHTVLAVLYERLGEAELAGKHYQKAIQSDPTSGDINNNYGVYLCRQDHRKQAIEHFEKALEDPFYSSPAVALANAGSCEMRRGSLSDAEMFLRNALQHDPRFPDALLSMSNLNYQQKNYLKSRAFLQRFEAATAQTSESLFLGYEIETAAGDEKTAGKYLTLLNRNFPESQEAKKARRINRQ